MKYIITSLLVLISLSAFPCCGNEDDNPNVDVPQQAQSNSTTLWVVVAVLIGGGVVYKAITRRPDFNKR